MAPARPALGCYVDVMPGLAMCFMIFAGYLLLCFSFKLAVAGLRMNYSTANNQFVYRADVFQ